MPDITLASEPRTIFGSRPAGRLRREGKVPAVVYGLGSDTVSITVPARELQHILAGESGANTLITLDVDGDDVLTLARQIQRHPTRGELVHVDFIRIRRDVAVSADIPLHLIGEAAGVRDGGLLEQLVFTITVEAMPGNIPVSVELDVAALTIGDQLHASDITAPRRCGDRSSTPKPCSWSGRRAARRHRGRGRGRGSEGEEGEAAEGEVPGRRDAVRRRQRRASSRVLRRRERGPRRGPRRPARRRARESGRRVRAHAPQRRRRHRRDAGAAATARTLRKGKERARVGRRPHRRQARHAWPCRSRT